MLLMFALLGSGHEALALLAICASSLPGVLTGLVPGRPSLRSPARREITRYTAWTSAHIVAAGGLLPALTLVVASTVSADDLGDFAAAASIATPLYLLSTAMRVSFEPFLARAHASGRDDLVRESTDRLMRAMVVLFVPMAGLLALWSDNLLGWLYPSTFASARGTFLLLLTGVAATCLNAAQAWLSATRTWGHVCSPSQTSQASWQA